MSDLNFTAKVENIDIEGLSKFLKAGAGIDIDDNRPTAIVKFDLDIDAREFGIRSISTIVTNVTAEINWQCYDDELTEAEIATLVAAGGTHMRGGTIEGTISIDSSKENNGKPWSIDCELKFKEDGQLTIDNVAINLIDNHITVS